MTEANVADSEPISSLVTLSTGPHNKTIYNEGIFSVVNTSLPGHIH